MRRVTRATILVALICAISACGGGGSSSDGNSSIVPPVEPVVTYKLYGVDFSPYKDSQDPNRGSGVSEKQIRERLRIIAPYTAWVRTFGMDNGLEKVPAIAREFGLKVAAGAWIGKDGEVNETQLDNLITAARQGLVELAVIGSEVLLRGDLTAAQLIDYIDRFRAAVPGVPVTTADVHSVWLDNPALVDACDLLFVNYYPYWEGVNIEQAAETIKGWHEQVKAAAGTKEVIVSETGWPSEGNQVGDAVPSLDNACRYFLEVTSWMRDENVKAFWFEAFDEKWKANYEGPQGAHWGIWDSQGVMKACMNKVFDGAVADN